jgi:hypothetical protein
MHTRLPVALLAVALTSSTFGAPAQAQRARVFVASYGNDSNPCTFLSPCRNFQQAINVVAAGGEVTAIDSAGFGPIIITQAVTITSPDGVEAGIAIPSGGTGITINAGANDTVSLHGLTLDGAGVGQDGIVFNTGKSLTIEKCVVRNLTTYGVNFAPNASSSLAVSDTLVMNIANFLAVGIIVQPSGSGTVTATFNRVETDFNFDGIGVSSQLSSGAVNATAVDSVAAGNSNIGFYAYSSGAAANLMLVRSVAANNFTGIEADNTGATLRVGQSALTGNTNGWLDNNAGGVVESYGTNQITGNASNETAPPSVTGGIK